MQLLPCRASRCKTRHHEGDAETQNGTRLGAFSARRQLARLLKDHRTAARKAPGDFVVARIGSLSKLSRIEAGKSPVSVPDVRAMAFLYGLDEVTTAQLVQLADHTSDSEWWEPYSAEAVVPDWFTNYMGLESYADRLLTYQETLVPGLLQTPAYHRAVFDSDPTADPATAERQVELRIKRQQTAFDKRSPLHVTAVLNEAVLVREVGGPAVMVEQREHLLELARRPHINIFVVPWTAGAHAAMKGSFSVLVYDDPDDPDVAYFETRAGGRYMQGLDQLQMYRADFDHVRDLSVLLEEYAK